MHTVVVCTSLAPLRSGLGARDRVNETRWTHKVIVAAGVLRHGQTMLAQSLKVLL